MTGFCLLAQMPQNPSPMVEHTRPHPRLTKSTPDGSRFPLTGGRLFLPKNVRARKPLLIFFHGGDWLPEVAAAKQHLPVIVATGGAAQFEPLVTEAETRAGRRFPQIVLAGWSAGCQPIREILKSPSAYPRITSVLCIDGIHTGYTNGKPGPLESNLETANLEIWVRFAKDAIAGRKTLLVTHSEIFPGTFASTTETANWITSQLGCPVRPILKRGPMGTQQIGEARAGRFRIITYAGNSAPDHVDQLHSLPIYLKWLH